MEKKTKKRNSLSKRQKSIIGILTQMNGKAITVSAISEKLNVSSRTILRELPSIEQWMSDNDFHFNRKPGKGLSISETQENLELIDELLHVENILPLYGREERRRQILGELLFQEEPVKTFVFTSRFDISEGTLSGDLDALDAWLLEYQVKVIRKPGVGVYLEGTEANVRQAITNAVLEFCDIDGIPALLSDFQEADSDDALFQTPLLTFFKPDIIRFTKRIIKECEQQLNVVYMDSSHLRLSIRIALAVYRMQQSKFLQKFSIAHDKLAGYAEFPVAKYVVSQMEKEFDLTIPETEIDYIAVHLSTTRIWVGASNFNDPLKAMNVRQVVMSMTAVVEKMLALPFKGDNTLMDDLSAHIAVMEKRKSMDILTENSQTEAVRQGYPEIYGAVETACQVLREWIFPKKLRTADIGYIAMHFVAAAERIQKNARKIVVAVVCPTGIASSKMLAASLTRAFPDLVIRRIISAFSINTDQLKREGIDLIISTVELQIDFPHICVDKMLKIQDKIMIQNTVEKMNRVRLQDRIQRRNMRDVLMNMEDIRRISVIGTEIVEILNHFCICRVENADDREDLMVHAAAIFADTYEMKYQIAKSFGKRESLGDTYIEEMEICLFHCETDFIEHSRFAYLLLDEPLQTEKGLLRGAVVMVVPRNQEDFFKEPIGRLSALLVEDKRFLQALNRCDTTAGIAFIEEALVKYYQQKISKYNGGIK